MLSDSVRRRMQIQSSTADPKRQLQMTPAAATSDLELRFADSIEEIGRDAWNALAGTDNPFMRYEFLHALEATGCTTEQTGWRPCHAVLRERPGDGDGAARAVMPLYLKTNSWGEYVFDWSWADAWRRHGVSYYPKLVTSAPFTPSTGRRIFADPSLDEETAVRRLRDGVVGRAAALGASSWHVLFPTRTEHEALAALDAQPRAAVQFHWRNPGYRDFDDFLAALSSRKRKAVRRERRRARDEGVRFRRTEGADITERQWREFYLFYQATYMVRGMRGYLGPDFFRAVAGTMPEQLFMVNAERDGEDIAAALFFKNRETLFGRYWGCAGDFPFVHFETCYYQGQEYAIEQGIERFDSGAQGEHKIQRGFEPVETWSNHWIADAEFAAAIADFLRRERRHVGAYRREAETLLPFRRLDKE